MKYTWDEITTIDGIEMVPKKHAELKLNIAWGMVAFLNVIIWVIILFGRG